MRTAALGFCLSGLIVSVFPALNHATAEYSIKTDVAGVFRTEALEPPPLGILSQGESLKLIQRGDAASLIRTSGGLQGWVRNSDLLAMESARGQKFGLGEQTVVGSDWNRSELILLLPPSSMEVVPLDRSFDGEIIEPMDKEQVEMKNGDN